MVATNLGLITSGPKNLIVNTLDEIAKLNSDQTADREWSDEEVKDVGNVIGEVLPDVDSDCKALSAPKGRKPP